MLQTPLLMIVIDTKTGPVPFCYSAECQPVTHREVGMGFAVAVNLFFAGVLTLFWPRIQNGAGGMGALGLFAGRPPTKPPSY
jgi:hypothetical protein